MTELRALIDASLAEHQSAIEGCAREYGNMIIDVAEAMANVLAQGGKLLACGNGGSACDAMHFAGECVGRFVSDRRPLPAIALSADPGIITAIGNDYGFETIFARQVYAHARPGDLLIAISTSGQSANVLNALEAANSLNLPSLLLTGERGRACALARWNIAVPTRTTAHIQETHIWLLQLMIACVEKKLFDL